jgi:hypothetical protein
MVVLRLLSFILGNANLESGKYVMNLTKMFVGLVNRVEML